MSFEVVRKGKLEYLRSTLLECGGVTHCFSTRYGGVSEGCLSSLNLGIHRGDKPENVRRNYEILGRAVGFCPEELVFTRQVHADIVVCVDESNRGDGLEREVTQDRDGLITNVPRVAVIAFSADCTPVLLLDPRKRVVAAVHSGWRGTAAGIVRRAVEQMRVRYGCDPENIRAAIGPCIGPCCFETHRDVPDAMLAALGPEAEAAIAPSASNAGKYHVDLKRLNEIWLRRAGVRQIDVSADCTACQPERFWSHRVVGNDRGSLAAIIMLTEPGRDAL